jgi:hypothetical protein
MGQRVVEGLGNVTKLLSFVLPAMTVYITTPHFLSHFSSLIFLSSVACAIPQLHTDVLTSRKPVSRL